MAKLNKRNNIQSSERRKKQRKKLAFISNCNQVQPVVGESEKVVLDLALAV